MSFFSQPNAAMAKEYLPPFGYWDQRLYEAFFSYKPSELELAHGRHFSCTVTHRETKLQHGLLPDEEYWGQEDWRPSKSEFCKIAFQLKVQDPEYWLTRHMNESNMGWMAFSYQTIDGRQRPSLMIAVKDEVQGGEMLSLRLSRLFAEVKAGGGKGVEISWSTILTSMLGTSAAQVWGDWDKDSPRDADGVLVPGKFPGRHAFELQSIEFKAVT